MLSYHIKVAFYDKAALIVRTLALMVVVGGAG